MTLYKRLFGAVRLLSAVLVAVLALSIAAHAIQTTTTPNAVQYSYNIAIGGADLPVITPASNIPVLVMGVQNTSGYRGVGQVTMLHVPGQFLEWVGLESPSAAAVTSGYSSASGTHIVYLDYSHTVDLKVNNADSFRVHNGNSFIAATGYITLIW
jgi:hypothetical protein